MNENTEDFDQDEEDYTLPETHGALTGQLRWDSNAEHNYNYYNTFN